MMDTLRYWIAVMLFVSTPPAVLYWFSIHPFVTFWRRVGVRWSVTIHLVGMVVFMVGLFRLRGWATRVDFGLNYWTVALAVPVFLGTGWLGWQRRKLLTMRTLAGVPELDAENPGVVLKEGLYACVRHPRYIEVAGAVLFYALLSNYLIGYLTLIAVIGAILVLVPIEERELTDRFGDEYLEYARQVPRFFPKRIWPSRDHRAT